MDFQRTLLAVAMESGEIQPEVILNGEVLEADPTEAYLATADELNRSLGVADSLERLRKRYDVEDVSHESLEIYRESVEMVFLSAGLQIPVSSVVPSFETVEKDGKASIKERANKAMQAVAKWIEEQIVKLKAQFKKMIAWFQRQYHATTATLAKAKERLKALPRKLKAERDRKEAKAKDSTLAYTREGLYEIFVKNGHFDHLAGNEIKEFLHQTASAELLFSGRLDPLHVNENVIVSDLVNKFHDFCGSNKPLIKDYTAEAHEVYAVADFLSDLNKDLFEAFEKTEDDIDGMEAYLKNATNQGAEVAIAIGRKSVAFLNKRRQYLLEIERYLAIFSNQCSNAIIKARAAGEKPAAEE